MAKPHQLVDTTNDQMVGQANPALSMAKLMALIINRAVLDAPACDDIRELLAKAAKGPDSPWLTQLFIALKPRDPGVAGVVQDLLIPSAKITHAKLGLGPLKNGQKVFSEVFRLEGLGQPNRTYAIALQNLNQHTSGCSNVAAWFGRRWNTVSEPRQAGSGLAARCRHAGCRRRQVLSGLAPTLVAEAF